MTDTQHNHPGPFGFVVCPDGCPRGAELAVGAPARRPAWTARLGQRARDDDTRREAMAAHFADPQHEAKCGRVCTAFDW